MQLFFSLEWNQLTPGILFVTWFGGSYSEADFAAITGESSFICPLILSGDAEVFAAP